MYYNFGRVHQTLRVTPAMQAGIADHVWSIDEIALGCLNSREHAYAVKATAGHCSHHYCSGADRVTALAGVAGVWASPSL
jgi:hypothetical protein